jgi:hypothetical protein
LRKESHRNSFPDKGYRNNENDLDKKLWNTVASRANYDIVGDHTDAAICADVGTGAHCNPRAIR